MTLPQDIWKAERVFADIFKWVSVRDGYQLHTSQLVVISDHLDAHTELSPEDYKTIGAKMGAMIMAYERDDFWVKLYATVDLSVGPCRLEFWAKKVKSEVKLAEA